MLSARDDLRPSTPTVSTGLEHPSRNLLVACSRTTTGRCVKPGSRNRTNGGAPPVCSRDTVVRGSWVAGREPWRPAVNTWFEIDSWAGLAQGKPSGPHRRSRFALAFSEEWLYQEARRRRLDGRATACEQTAAAKNSPRVNLGVRAISGRGMVDEGAVGERVMNVVVNT
jgi:hypothetical protein